ncbi:MAG: hypothetical protein K0R98_1026 [Rickettsiaceae bacterium]|nr:hypothetical protein [Rickettsiaceae bacterium]
MAGSDGVAVVSAAGGTVVPGAVLVLAGAAVPVEGGGGGVGLSLVFSLNRSSVKLDGAETLSLKSGIGKSSSLLAGLLGKS